ncbi:MAG: ABC transporter ATP-binding protein, partial [Oscillibacter sp.]
MSSAKKPVLFWLWGCLKPRWGAVLALCVSAVCSALGTVGLALAVRQVVDVALNSGENLPLWMAVLLLLTATLVLLNLATGYLTGHTADLLAKSLRSRLMARLFTRQQGSLEQFHSGELVNRLGGDVRAVCENGLTALPNLLGRLARLAGAMAALALMSPGLALFLLAAGLLLAAGGGLLAPKLKAMSHAVRGTEGALRSELQETLKNRLTVKAFGAEGQLLHRVDARQEKNRLARKKHRKLSLTASGGFSAAAELGYALALCWGIGGVAAGTMSFGTLTAVLQLLLQLRGPVVGLAGTLPGLASVAASAERLMELENLPGEPEGQKLPAHAQFLGLKLSHVSFSYGDAPVLQDFSAVLAKGDCVALTGISGIGKSTLLALLLGFYTPLSGSLTIETDGGEFPCGVGTRNLFAYVPQDHALLSGSLRENLLLAAPDASEEALWQALAVAEADFVKDLPNGLDTQLFESGGGLS